jgi:hypothetical protein
MGICCLAIFVTSHLFAATIDDIAGLWSVTFQSKFKVRGEFSDSDRTAGYCALYQDGTFVVSEDDAGTVRLYSGTYSLINGKKIEFQLSTQGIDELKDMLADWIVEVASGEGISVTEINFIFSKTNLSKVNIRKKDNMPKKAKISIKGTVSGKVDGVPTTKKYNYKSKMTFEAGPW